MATILVAEDNATTRKLVRFTLEKKGYTIIEAEDGKAALAAVKRQAPDLVLQDLMLPDMDGFALAVQLRALLSHPRVPILAFSGFVSTLDETRIAAVGFDDIILKPVAPSRLLQIVQAHLPEATRSESQFGRGRALVVADDDPIQAKLVTFRLERLGFTVMTAPDGVQALAMARAKRPDAIVSDIMMPGIDGFRLCIEARRDASLKEVPVILVTSSYVEEADRKLAEQAGASSCVLRTPNLEEIITALRETLGSRAAATPPSVDYDKVERDHAQRVIQQLERQVLLNAGMTQQCTVLSAELSILSGISSTLSRSGDLDASLDEVLSMLFDAGGVSTGALLLFEGARTRVRSLGARGLWSDAALGAFFGDLDELRARLAKGAPLTLPEEGGGLRVQEALDAAQLGSALIVPLSCRDELVGALFITSPHAKIGEEDRISFIVSASAQIAQGIALARAFAAQAAAMRHAQESEATLRSIMESASEGILVADERGRFLYLNPAAINTGIHPGELGPEHIASCGLFLPDRSTLFPAHQLPLARAIRGERVKQVELFVRNAAVPKGAWLSVNAQPLVSVDGKQHGGVAVFRDVTTEKATQEQLMISDRMASVGTLAAGVAHEINNPLTSVMANLQFAEQRIATFAKKRGAALEFEELQEVLHDASEASISIRNIVRDLKLFSHHENDQTGPVDVHKVLDSTLRMARNELRHRARLVKDYGQIPPAEATDSRLGQVFLNLIMNAAQAIPEGQMQSNEIRISTRTENDRLIIEIADTGPGMSPEVLSRLFITPFFTTKPKGVGTGLGLSICHRIVTDFGGAIEAKSEAGKGTVFRVSLLPARAAEEERPPTSKTAISAQRRARILVIDDEPMINRMVQRLLASEHEVVALMSAGPALQHLISGERFDVILCDLMMPQMTGMEFHAELLRLDQEQAARVIFLTGGAFTPKARAFLDETLNLRIDKPFDTMHLRAVINERLRSTSPSVSS